MSYWQTSRRKIGLDRPLVMGILNVTPDSFSDGSEFQSVDAAVKHAERMIADGAHILDIGGESTRPGSKKVSVEQELKRVAPVIEALAKAHNTPISIDTSKSEVARQAIEAGAEIINDISGLRWDEKLADVAAAAGAGLVLMHSRGTFETMHSQPPVNNIVAEVTFGLKQSLKVAKNHDIADEQIAVDIGIGFGKAAEQNLELLAKLDKLVAEFDTYPMLVGTSRKSFIGRVLNDAPPSERLGGSLATALFALSMGAKVVRVHDVRETVSAIRALHAINERSR